MATNHSSLAPWAFTAAILAVLASWDLMFRGGELDAVLMGLAAYELLIGLTTEPGWLPSATHIERAAPETPAR